MPRGAWKAVERLQHGRAVAGGDRQPVTRRPVGHQAVRDAVPDDAAMARYLAAAAVALGSPYPYGWAEDAAEAAAVRTAAHEQVDDWREQVRLPYLDMHREYGAAGKAAS